MSLILPANSLTGGYEIDNSLRFNPSSNDNLGRNTWGTATSDKIFTMSVWVKRSGLGYQQIVNSYDGSTGNDNQLKFQSTDAVELTVSTSGAEYFLKTNRLFRDISAWFHIVFAFDSTQATASDRYKLYVNGTQETSFSSVSYPPQNTTYQFFRNSNGNYIGTQWNGSGGNYNGYMSEFYFIDGQALAPTDFGEFDQDTGIWKPIKYTGTYGTNGFYLDFENSGSLGADQSGNGNNFTVNNLTSIDQVTDTPTNNFCTWNGLIKSDVTLSEGNLEMTGGALSYDGTVGTIVPTQGKWYAEIKVTVPTFLQIGFITIDSFIDGARALYSSSSNIYWQDNATEIAYFLNSVSQGNATVTGGTNSVPTYTTNDIIMLAMDLDNGYGWFGKNGTWQNSGDPANGTNAFNLASDYANGTTIYSGQDNSEVQANFGNPPFTIASGNSDADGYGNFEYAVPSGYYSLCTKNLAKYG